MLFYKEQVTKREILMYAQMQKHQIEENYILRY